MQIKTRSKATISFLFDDPLPAPRLSKKKSRHKHPPAPHKPASQIRSPKAKINIRKIPVSERHLLPIPDDNEFIARYHAFATTVAHAFEKTYHASHEDFEDSLQECFIKILKIKLEHRNHDRYVKLSIENSLKTFYGKHTRLNEPLTSIDPDWDADPSDEADIPLLARLKAPDDSALCDLISSEFVTQALKSLPVEQALVISLYLGLGDHKPIRNLRTLSKKSFVAESKLPAIIRSVLAKLKRWYRDSLRSLD